MGLRRPRLDDLKGRFASKDTRASQSRHSSAYSADDFDDFAQEDFGEYAFDDEADYAQPDSTSTSTLRSAQIPRLVTADDIRSHTQYTPSGDAQATRPNRDFASLRADDQRSTRSGTSSPDSDIASRPRHAASASDTEASSPTSRAASSEGGSATASKAEPRATQRATRIITVVAPDSYADAERIAKVLKSGDVAVLSLRNTPDALGKRILDFSFGIACALDARVECVSGQVFAITRGVGLTDGESARLRDQGLM